VSDLDTNVQWIDTRKTLLQQAQQHGIGEPRRISDDPSAIDDPRNLHALDPAFAAASVMH
jgi:hypothetical protein